MIKVIKDKKGWNECLSLVNRSDFYYTYDYHHLSKNDDETPILIKYTQGLTSLILPLLLRDIDNTGYKDATSVYGYAGILALNVEEQFDQEKFKNELNTFFIHNKIVSVFSRLHPFIDYQDSLLKGLGSITLKGKVVYIDLNETIENQRMTFNRRLKTYLNKSRKSCTVIEGNLKEHLDTFTQLYRENMIRVDADESYFFSDQYFNELLTSTDFKSKLLICLDNHTQAIIGGAIFIMRDNIVQYHLSGLSDGYFDLNPIKLIIDEMRIKSTQNGYKYLNLGGGRGSREDSLFRFKSGFSKDFKDFKLWKYIVDEKIYQELVEKNLGKYSELDFQNIAFFPAYRLRLKETI